MTILLVHFENVMTIKTHENYYEVLQKQNITEKNAPLLRVPISNTILDLIMNKF